ncbi:hypothetical protein GQ457_02G020510 [Hibiscus cannabinus]
MTWELKLGWVVARLKGRSLLIVILQLTWSTFIYIIWKERNLRIFQRKFSHEDSLIHSIKDKIDHVLVTLCFDRWPFDPKLHRKTRFNTLSPDSVVFSPENVSKLTNLGLNLSTSLLSIFFFVNYEAFFGKMEVGFRLRRPRRSDR